MVEMVKSGFSFSTKSQAAFSANVLLASEVSRYHGVQEMQSHLCSPSWGSPMLAHALEDSSLLRSTYALANLL